MAAPAQPGCGFTETAACACSPSPSLENPISAGWWPVGPLGVGQRLEEPHGSRSHLQGWSPGRWLGVALQVISPAGDNWGRKGEPHITFSWGGGTSLLRLEQIQSKGLGRVPGKETVADKYK